MDFCSTFSGRQKMMAVGLELLQLDYENAHFHKIGMKTGV